MANKRQFTKLLAACNQTDAISKFFGATVDQVFQPGTSVNLSGYVGQYPTYFNAATDFYVDEPTTSRKVYQLEPGMVSYDTAGAATFALNYPDLVSYLKTSGANTTNERRLFQSEYYSWSPPVDIDKLLNFDDYCWFGDALGQIALPTLVISAPVAMYVSDGIETIFQLPAAVPGMTSGETPSVYVNNLAPSAFGLSVTIDGANVILGDSSGNPPPTGLNILVTRIDSIETAMRGQTTFPLAGLVSYMTETIADGITAEFPIHSSASDVLIEGNRTTVGVYINGVALPITSYMVGGDAVTLNNIPPVTSVVNVVTFRGVLALYGVPDLLPSGIAVNDVPYLSSTMRIQTLDASRYSVGWDETAWDADAWDAWDDASGISETGTYFVDGVGATIRLTPNESMVSITAPQYTLIDRSSIDENMWSLTNHWVHSATYSWSGQSFTGRRAQRPIIEFVRDIVLWSYGSSQQWSESVPPLFMLYDVETIPSALDDPTTYRGSNFAGSKIFSFAAGSGSLDSVLGIPLEYDNNGYIVFENDAVTKTYTYLEGGVIKTIGGLCCYGQLDGSVLVTSSLWHPVSSFTTQYYTGGFYTIPPNLQANPTASDVEYLSKSDISPHFSSILSNQVGFIGLAGAVNNWRDTPRDLSLGTEVLQHRAPLLKTMLLASDKRFDVPAAIYYASQEYNRFRNKFARKLSDLRNRGLVLDGATNAEWITAALQAITIALTPAFPFALSTMGGGNYYIAPTPAFLGVIPATTPNMFVDDTYPTPILTLRGHDGSLTPAFGSPVYDVSGNLTSSDWRDPIMVAMEQQIYDSILPQFIAESRLQFDIQKWTTGRFRAASDGSYNLGEMTAILSPMFETWAMTGRFDFRQNTTYSATDPFSWNYRACPDRYGSLLPGNWRAIYRWYFDTDRPHQCPWQMLGFADEPSWWVSGSPSTGFSGYGTSYARTNTQLWADLEAGRIQAGPRRGIDTNYARPGLSEVIPIDANGKLLDPVACGIVPQAPIYQLATRAWLPGDHGPIENLWVNSPAYRFALSEAGFLMKPAEFVETMWDSQHSIYIGQQWVDSTTNNRPQNGTALVHGEINSAGAKTTVVGIQQWLVDNLVAAGLSSQPTTQSNNKTAMNLLGNATRGLAVRLIHKMASFVSGNNLKVVADNYGTVPAEDVAVMLYNSPALTRDFYSGVIVEWTGTGYRVMGYDAQDSYFLVNPPDFNGPKGIISLATTQETTVLTWTQNTYYTIGTNVLYKGSTYICTKAHTSASPFDNSYWRVTTVSMARAPRVTTYLRGTGQTIKIPYATVFSTIQEVSDFLLGYERYLVGRGWVFDTIDPTTSVTRNWSDAVNETLIWSQIDWAPGNFIALSPGALQLGFTTATGTILNVENPITGFFGLLDRSGSPISARSVDVSRIEGNVTITSQSSDIFACCIETAEVEHALIFNNTTIFNDINYLPLFNMRQSRFLLIGSRSNNWAGRLDAPGYVLIAGVLAPSFDKNVEDIRLMFEIEKIDRPDLCAFARHLIGYQDRSYMNTLLLSETEQFEFYQGMIQSKGSPGVFSKLLRSQYINADSDIQFLEEWAIRVNRFGGPIDPFITLTLRQGDIRADPQLIRFAATPGADPFWLQHQLNDPDWVDPPAASNFFPVETSVTQTKVPTAGPVRLSDVNYTAFYITDEISYYITSYTAGRFPFQVTERLWVYSDLTTNDWNVFEVFEIGSVPVYVTNVVTSAEDTRTVADGGPMGIRLFFDSPINLTTADIGKFVIVEGSSYSTPDLLGLQTIVAVNPTLNSIDLDTYGLSGYDFTTTDHLGTPRPTVRIFDSVRFVNEAALTASPLAWTTGDMVWLDADANDRWIVMEADLIGYGVDQYDLDPYDMGDVTIGGTEWSIVRNQPNRVKSDSIVESEIYKIGAVISMDSLFVDQPVIDDLIVIDPLQNLLPGIAGREIEYIFDMDPARYNAGFFAGASNVWGANQVGQVWWDASTVRFIDPCTDTLGITNERDVAELDYRAKNWATIAPNTTITLYEWVASDVSPSNWATAVAADTTGKYSGTVYQPSTPSWVQETAFSITSGVEAPVYYFWVTGRSSVPSVSFRKSSLETITKALTNPAGLELSWIAPIAADTLLIGGVSPFLNDVNTVLKVQVDSGIDDKGHDEWMLLRPGDNMSLPPDWLWRKLRDSLCGFNDQLEPLPSPSLHVNRSVGVFDGQNMFSIPSTSATRGGLMDARQSFVDCCNKILARAPICTDRYSGYKTLSDLVDSIPQEIIDPITGVITYPPLQWTRPTGTQLIVEPPAGEYDYEVYSVRERDLLLMTPAFRIAITNGTALRVLINRTTSSTPQWSIWRMLPIVAAGFILGVASDAINQTLMENASSIFEILPVYDQTVTDHAALVALTNITASPLPTDGTRVLVSADDTVGGFWTIYRYVASSNTFVLYRSQLWDLSNFYTPVDWYAQNVTISGNVLSFSTANPPMVSYPTEIARNFAEGTTNPSNLLVKITNASGTGSVMPGWYWTAFDTTPINGNAKGWTVVAHEAGTIALSTNFYDATRPVFGLDPIASSVGNVATRDGSFELRVVADALRDYIFTPAEINELFFSMVHFVHTQQNDVDWLFKTSFIVVAGYAQPLTQTGVQSPDVKGPLTDYVNEVKPYHCKIRAYEQQYSAGMDVANVTTTEARTFKITILFDRVTDASAVYDDESGVDGDAYGMGESAAGTSLERILKYYTGSLTTDQAMNAGFKGSTIIGANMDASPVAVDINPDLQTDPLLQTVNSYSINATTSTDALGYGLDDPYVDAHLPEERVHLVSDDGLVMHITSGAHPGAPLQTVKTFDVSDSLLQEDTFYYGLVAQSANGVLVWLDGVRAILGVDYTVNHLARSVTIQNLVYASGVRVQKIVVRVIGFGGTVVPTEQRFLDAVDGQTTFALNAAVSVAQVSVLVNGNAVGLVQHNDTSVTLDSSAPVVVVGDDVALSVVDPSTACRVFNEILSYNALQTWTLSNPDRTTVPSHAGTIVEMNGVRLTPPLTYYGSFTAKNRSIVFDIVPLDASVLTIYVNGLPYAPISDPLAQYPIPICTTESSLTDDYQWLPHISYVVGTPVKFEGDSYHCLVTHISSGSFDSSKWIAQHPFGAVLPTGFAAPNNSQGKFALIGQQLVSLDPSFNATEVCVVISQGHDYTVTEGELVVLKPMTTTDSLTVTTFSNATTMGIRTQTFLSNPVGYYPMSKPIGSDYVMVYYGGSLLVDGVDYTFTRASSGFDTSDFGDSSWDGSYQTGQLSIPRPGGSPPVWIVVTTFSGALMRPEISWLETTQTPAILRMIPRADDGGFDNSAFGLNGFETSTGVVLTLPNVGTSDVYGNTLPIAVYDMHDKWERVRQGDLYSGLLATSLGDGDATIVVSVPSLLYSAKFWPAEPFMVPNHLSDCPGVVWIDGERIEYLSFERVGNQITLGTLQRRTHGTSGTTHIQGVYVYNGNNSFSSTIPVGEAAANPLNPLIEYLTEGSVF